MSAPYGDSTRSVKAVGFEAIPGATGGTATCPRFRIPHPAQ